MNRPTNLLVIMTDQQSSTAMSCAGNPDLATPAIDSIAARGVRFANAYCTNPLCAPSRASMVTGRMPSELGVDDNIYTLPEDFPSQSMGRVFADAGYDCAYGGKWHVVDQRLPASSGFTELCADAHAELPRACGQFLREDARRDRPFLLVASFNEPHGICEWARGQSPPSGEVPDPTWDELPTLPANHVSSTPEPAGLRRVREFAWQVHPTREWDEWQWRRYRHAYYRLCERVDAQIGLLLAELERSGHGDDTVVVFTADHGDGMGAHGWNQKKVLYDEVAKVPFIVAPASPRRAGAVDDALVSVGLDLLPTLCDYAGIAAGPHWRGRSVRAGVDADAPSAEAGRDHVVTETVWHFPSLALPPKGGNLSGRMLRTRTHKYVCYSWGQGREQLFDLAADPGEMVNLATSGRHQPVLGELRTRMRRSCDETGDAFGRFIPSSGARAR